MLRNKEAGFTLVELIAAIVIMGLLVIGITNLYIAVQTAQRRSYHLEMATRAGEKQIETLRNALYSNLVPDSTLDFTADLPEDLPEPNSGSVAITEPQDGIRRVDVTISYKDGGGSKVVKQSSLIGMLGIGQQ